jgi:hypothetical protein
MKTMQVTSAPCGYVGQPASAQLLVQVAQALSGLQRYNNTHCLKLDAFDGK